MGEKKLIILKAGRKLDSLNSIKGDFENWILDKLPALNTYARVVNIQEMREFPDHQKVAGIIITGSSAMVTEQEDWVLRSEKWLERAVESNIPILGICFGHQLLAHALGGTVDYNPKGIEVGTVSLKLLDASKKDRLFNGIEMPIQAQASHRQCVLELPSGSVRLACTDMDENHAFRYGDQAWGVQFHPEFNLHIVSAYIDFYAAHLHDDKKDFHLLRETADETGIGNIIFNNFFNVVTSYLHQQGKQGQT